MLFSSASNSSKYFICSDEIILTNFAIEIAVKGWSPVTIITLILPLWQLLTASATPGLGGSISDIKPAKQKHFGKLFSSISIFKSFDDKKAKARPSTRSPFVAKLNELFKQILFVVSKSSIKSLFKPFEHKSIITSGAPLIKHK